MGSYANCERRGADTGAVYWKQFLNASGLLINIDSEKLSTVSTFQSGAFSGV
jgi:hypothetical protein